MRDHLLLFSRCHGLRSPELESGAKHSGGNNCVSLWEKKMKLGTGSRETMGNSTKINIPRWPDREPGSQASETRAALRKPTRQWALNSDEETRAGKSRQRLCLCPPGPSYRSSIHLGEKQTKSVKNQVNSCQQATLSTAFRSTRHQQEGSCHLGEATI